MRPLIIKLTLASLLFAASAAHAGVVSITASGASDMSDYDMSDSDGIPTPFGFNNSGPLISNGDTVTSMTFLLRLASVDAGTTISSVFVNYNTSSADSTPVKLTDHHVCDQNSISIQPSPLTAGIVTVSCTFTTPFAMPGYSFWFTGLDAPPSQPGSQLHLNSGSVSLTFNDANVTSAPEPTCFLFAGTGLLLIAVGRRSLADWVRAMRTR